MKNLALLTFIITLGLNSCKKDEDKSIYKYTLVVVDANQQTEYTGASTQKAVVVKIMQGSQMLQYKDINANLEVVTPNCVVDGFYIPNTTPQYKYTVNTDGTLNIYWYTGNTAGNQTVSVILTDVDTKQTIASTQTSINVAANPSGFYATCLKHRGRLIALNDNHYTVRGDFYHFESLNSGLTWGEGTATGDYNAYPRGLLSGKKAKNFSFYHAGKNTIYMNFGMGLYKSTDYGLTWELANQCTYKGSVISLVANNYLGFIEPNKFLISQEDWGLYLYEIRENNSDTLYFVNPLPDLSSAIKLNDGSILTCNYNGIVFKASNLTDNFTNINANFICDYLFKDNTGLVYGFSNNAIYQYNGSTFNKIADLNLPQNQLVYDVIYSNGQYYLATCNIWNSNSELPKLYSGNTISNLTPTNHNLNRYNTYLTKSANGSVGFQNEFGFYQIKK